MIVTTSGRATSQIITRAKTVANKYRLPYIERNGLSVENIKQKCRDDVVVVGNDGLFIVPFGSKDKMIFHPNVAMIRAKRIFSGATDPLIAAADLAEGMTFLDCTLGLGADSIIASIAVGRNGSVISLEKNPLLFLLVTEGLATAVTANKRLDEAMRRIQTVHTDHYTFLQQAKSKSFDVVYFDPMFHITIDTANGIQAIRRQTVKSELTSEIIAEAKRVARKKVILKDHWQSSRFTALGFRQLKRKTSLFHYGVIEL